MEVLKKVMEKIMEWMRENKLTPEVLLVNGEVTLGLQRLPVLEGEEQVYSSGILLDPGRGLES